MTCQCFADYFCCIMKITNIFIKLLIKQLTFCSDHVTEVTVWHSGSEVFVHESSIYLCVWQVYQLLVFTGPL